MRRKVMLGDHEVTRIGLGTNRLRNTEANIALIKAGVDAGLQMIDSAHLYTGGESEETIGAALKPFPNDVVIATKGGHGDGRPDVLGSEIAESFRRLQTGVIPLYYLHRVDPKVPIEESLAVIKEQRDGGKIRHVGVSQVTIDQIERARKVVPIVAVQNHYNLSERKSDDAVDYCAREGIVFVPFFPLGAQPTPALREIAARHRATSQQVMLAWLLHRSPAMLPIPGTLSLEHLKQNLGALDIEMADAEIKRLDG